MRLLFTGVGTLKKMYPPFYSSSFHNVSLWAKVFLGAFASHVVITPFGHFVKLASHPGTLPGLVKKNSAPPL